MSVRQAYFHGFGDIRIHETDREPVGPTQLRVEPVVVGMNPGTMRAHMTGEHARMREEYVPLRHAKLELDLPMALGQNGVGRVVEVGDDVEGIGEGDLVQAGIDYATESVVDATGERGAMKLPDGSVDLEEYVFMTQGGVALNAVRRSGVTLGDSVAVIGQGPIGLGVTRMAKLAGARPLLANDLFGNRLALSRRLGATETTDATREALVEEVLATIGVDPRGEGGRADREGIDVVFDCAGVSDAVWAGLKLLRSNGTLCVASMHKDPLEGINLGGDFHLREIEIISAQGWGRPNTWPWTTERNRELYLELAAAGELGFGEMITDRVAFGDLPGSNLFERLVERPAEAVYGVVTFE